MKAVVVRQFQDKHTKRIRQQGMVFELSKERFEEIKAAEEAYGFQLIKEYDEPKKEEPTTAEPKEEEPAAAESETEEVEEEPKTSKKRVSKK